MNYNELKIAPLQAEAILLDLYGIKGKASVLPGDTDFNFKIDVDGQTEYILKISRPGADEESLKYQIALLDHLTESDLDVAVPKVVPDANGNAISEITNEQGDIRKVRLLTWVSGRLWSSVNPQLDVLRYDLGAVSGKITEALQNFDHSVAHRQTKWDIAHGLWVKDHLNLFSEEEKEIVAQFLNAFEETLDSYKKLRTSVIHHDLNDNNIVVSSDPVTPKVVAPIDYGDAIHTQTINDLAIACAYACMGHADPLEAALPLVKGYHDSFPLLEEELTHLYVAIAMRLIISVTHSTIAREQEPENEYLQISAKPGWDLLRKWRNVNPEYAEYSFRKACGFLAHPNSEAFRKWADSQSVAFTDLFPSEDKKEALHLDLSVSSWFTGHQSEFNDLDLFQFKIDRLQQQHPDKLIAGGYLEPRSLYTSTEYDKVGNSGRESRTVHLGIDFWLPAGTPVHALFDGEVVTAVNDAGDKEYGGLIILKHQANGFDFYTLHGHLTVASAESKNVGDIIKKGECVGHLGNYPENGNWAPHLHFQIMLSTLDYTIDFPGVGYLKQLEVWQELCPDPNLLFKSEALRPQPKSLNEELIAYRKSHLGKSLSLQYNVPLHIVRGSGPYLIDQFGTRYLDTVNNVNHVGHQHPDVVKAGQSQMALLNTNTRYLHENIITLSRELLETFPPELSVAYFVNSGSEANELAMRMVKAATGSRDMIVSEVGYHGNTNACVDISSYKFDGKGGSGAPEHTHVFPIPDAFRGKYRGKDTGEKYSEEVQNCIDAIHEKGREVGGFIIEPILSCGGQIELPDGFLSKAYAHIRKAGGVCISDEVQVGIGRVGKTFWGFQLHDVVPDIVTIGKPLGDGHPVAALVCTQEVADAFANGMEYFNTFGGNPVSCAIATEVLRIVKRDGLQQHALEIGEFLKGELQQLASEFPIIGDVRGQGLFLGIELVDQDLNALTEQTAYLANRMKDHSILMSVDGPDENVLKIKPPMVFDRAHAEELILYLRKIFAEDFMNLRNA